MREVLIQRLADHRREIQHCVEKNISKRESLPAQELFVGHLLVQNIKFVVSHCLEGSGARR